MELCNKSETARRIVADDMILTKELPTTAGSKMLEGYVSLFEAEVLTRLSKAGYSLCGKADVGEFAIDLVGETAHGGAWIMDGKLVNAAAHIVKEGEAEAAITLDVNGSVRRGAAQSDLVSVKPTYGTVSRFGTVPVACSGETVSVMAQNANTCQDILRVIVGHDDKDGTSLPEEMCAKVTAESAAVRRVAVLTNLCEGVEKEVAVKISAFCDKLAAQGVEVCKIENTVIPVARPAWNILMSAELCNNVSRYDGVKYGYRTENFTNLDELYTNSRTEAFGPLLKTAILFGSDTLSTENYMRVYDKALRTRRVIVEEFQKLFGEFDAVLMPACSTMAYTEETVEKDPSFVFTENLYTAPASITGLPAVVAEGVQLVGKAFSESALLSAVASARKEGN